MHMKKVLVAPLNWGLGHATRSIPVINELLKQGAEVFIASDGNALQLLKLEFPRLTFFELPSYNITYGSGNTMIFEMFKIFKNSKNAMAAEHEVLQKLIAEYHFDLIISDNRYGIWNSKIHSVFITHQINIQLPAYLKWLQPLLLNSNLKQLSNFNECWIPDNETDANLSGALSHNCKLPDNTYYIGLLSRFFSFQPSVFSWLLKKSNLETASEPENERLQTAHCKLQTPLPTASCPLPFNDYQLLILLSGPEPQRTIFEKLISRQVQEVKYKTLIVQGLTQQQEVKQLNEKVTMISYLTASDMYTYITSAEIVISRSGYSTIMDLAATNCKALLVPTPGQTEQEYLANKLNNEGVFYAVKQADFKIADVEKAKTFKGLKSENNVKIMEQRIKLLLA